MSVSTHLSSSNSNEITQETQDTNVDREQILQVNFELKIAQEEDWEILQEHSELSSLQVAATSRQDKSSKTLRLVSQDLKFIREASEKIKKFDGQVDNKLKDAHLELQSLESRQHDEPIDDDVKIFRRRVTKFKVQIPFKIKISDEQGGHRDTRFNGSSRDKQIQNQNYELSRIVDILFADAKFKLTSASKDFLLVFGGLDINLKLCLLCFAVFPENVIIRKRLMIYWWLGEGFLIPSPGDKKTAEELGDEFFGKLIQKDFITSAHKKRTLAVNSCKMHPFVRSAVILLAKEANFFDFDSEARLKDNYSSSLRLCLVGDDYYSSRRSGLVGDNYSPRSCLVGDRLVNTEKKEVKTEKKEVKTEKKDVKTDKKEVKTEKKEVKPEKLDTIHTFFNLNEDILDFKPELFSKMTNVNVVYLGRWQATAKHHVEIDDPKILEGFKVMKHLKFLSLQGISRITKLPGSISKLQSLTILDLRACHSLEAIPGEIGSLESLMHLDMSECYLLDNMPKELSFLKSLLVLKGFVVGAGSKDKASCTLEDLAKLPELRKLGIYTNKEDFPGDQDLMAFSKFDHLTNLGITWGSNQAKSAEKSMAKVELKGDEKKKEIKTATEGEVEGDKKKKEMNTATERQGTIATYQNKSKSFLRSNAMPRAKAPGLPTQLKKLDLRCFPRKYAPSWLSPDNLQSLTKLYIRGGKICVLGQSQEWNNEEIQPRTKWKVDALRLKYLSELRMDWKEVQSLFPNLEYLEKLRCPKLTLFPCDIFGVWIDNTSKARSNDDNTKAQSNYNKWHPEFAFGNMISNSLIATSD